MIYNLIYSSTAHHEMTFDELMEILERARQKNTELDITGMLLYRDRDFLQVLEGSKDIVLSLYQKIQRDKRHDHVNLISITPVQSRIFPDWTMGFVDLENIDLKSIPGYFDFWNMPLNSSTFRRNLSLSYGILRAFKRQHS